MRIRKSHRPSTSSDKLELSCPSKWCELSQDQLRYVLHLIGSGYYQSAEIRTLMLIRFCNIEVLRKHTEGFWSCSIIQDGKKRFFDLQTWQVQDMIGQLQFIDKPEEMDVRLETIQNFHAVNRLLHGLPFYDYLNVELCYQGWLATKSNERIEKMASYLYVDDNDEHPDTIKLTAAEVTGTLFWYYHIKTVFARTFSNFFKPATTMGGNYDHLGAVNAQIRALTDGDVTKEDFIKGYDTWRCLTELDAKARDAAEFKEKYGNK